MARSARSLLASWAPWARQGSVLALDGTIAAAAFWSAMMLRFEGTITEGYLNTLPAMTTLLVCCRLLANVTLRLQQWSFQLSGLADGARVGFAGLSGTGLFLGILYLVEVTGTPRSVVVLELLMSTLLMAALRFSPRLAGMYMTDWARTRREGAVKTLILGAGAAGDMLLRDLRRSGDHGYRVVGFLDDDRSKWGIILGGKRVLGGMDDLPRVAAALGVEQVLITIPWLRGRRIREILSLCAEVKLRFKILPESFVSPESRGPFPLLRDLSPNDLLMREPVVFARSGALAAMSGRVALVTGAAGSIGSEICEQLLKAGSKMLAMSDLNENGLYLLAHRFARDYPDATVRLEVADIRDAERILALFDRYRPHDVFHAAAHKHVPLMESAPCEAVKNNVQGTRNVAQAAHAYGTERMVYISTDKAVQPTSVMGVSKRVGEYVVRAMARRSTTRFCAVRFGNVLGSAGSVVPLFMDQIAGGGPVRVTHPEMRRYFMTIPEAVALVLHAAYGDYGELCVLDMGEPIRIVDLARHMITMAGLVPDLDIPIVFTGLRPGEKLYEELLTEEEERTRQVNDKILVAECPPPPPDLEDRLRELLEAAMAEDDASVVDQLRELVPSYTPSETSLAAGRRVPSSGVGNRPA